MPAPEVTHDDGEGLRARTGIAASAHITVDSATAQKANSKAPAGADGTLHEDKTAVATMMAAGEMERKDREGDCCFGEVGCGDAGKPQQQHAAPNKISMWPLVALIYFEVSGGPYGIEDAVGAAGPLYALLGCFVFPIIWSIPEALVTAEMVRLHERDHAFSRALHPCTRLSMVLATDAPDNFDHHALLRCCIIAACRPGSSLRTAGTMRG